MSLNRTSGIQRPAVHRVIIAQLLVTFILAAAAGFLLGRVHGVSALLGGLICAIPNAVFAWRSFSHAGASAARAIVKSFYRAEALKLGLTALFFGLTFRFVHPLEPASLFLAFFIVQVTHWSAPLLLKRRAAPTP